MKIKAAVVREKGGPLSIETLELEGPRDDEILVRVVATGVCHTDVVVRDGLLPTPHPVVLGHEGAGIVERVGRSVTKVTPGDAVVMTYDSCGRCPACAAHAQSYCHAFFPRNFFGTRSDSSTALSKDGERIHSHFFGQSSFATHAVCHERNIVKVPADAPLELLGPLACGVQTGAGAVMNALRVPAGLRSPYSAAVRLGYRPSWRHAWPVRRQSSQSICTTPGSISRAASGRPIRSIPNAMTSWRH